MGNKQRKTGVLPAFLLWPDGFVGEEKGTGIVRRTNGNVKVQSFPAKKRFCNSN